MESKIKILGVWHSIEPELTINLNLNEKTEKSRTCKLTVMKIKPTWKNLYIIEKPSRLPACNYLLFK